VLRRSHFFVLRTRKRKPRKRIRTLERMANRRVGHTLGKSLGELGVCSARSAPGMPRVRGNDSRTPFCRTDRTHNDADRREVIWPGWCVPFNPATDPRTTCQKELPPRKPKLPCGAELSEPEAETVRRRPPLAATRRTDQVAGDSDKPHEGRGGFNNAPRGLTELRQLACHLGEMVGNRHGGQRRAKLEFAALN